MKHNCRALVIGVLLATRSVAALGEEAPPYRFLRQTIGLHDADLAAVERGTILTRRLPASDMGEIVAFGVVKTAGNAELLTRLARDVRSFRSGPRVSALGTFGTPARLEDLSGLRHPPEDLAALRKCRPGSCDVKLGTRGLELLGGVDWSAADAERQAAAILDRGIVEFVAAYQRGGIDALGDVVDKKTARARAEDHRAVLAHSPYLFEFARGLAEHVAGYPARRLEGAEDTFYWTTDTSGPKPVTAAYHVIVQRTAQGTLVATRLLGATHFFNAALDLLAGVAAPDGRGLYLMCLYRTRLDPPTGPLAGALLGKVRDGIETGVRASLETARARLAAVR